MVAICRDSDRGALKHAWAGRIRTPVWRFKKDLKSHENSLPRVNVFRRAVSGGRAASDRELRSVLRKFESCQPSHAVGLNWNAHSRNLQARAAGRTSE